jgi:hypothetical protein
MFQFLSMCEQHCGRKTSFELFAKDTAYIHNIMRKYNCVLGVIGICSLTEDRAAVNQKS